MRRKTDVLEHSEEQTVTEPEFQTVFSKPTHGGQALECFGFSQNEDGSVTLMRWVQTPYDSLASPPELFDISGSEWRALLDKCRPSETCEHDAWGVSGK